jgi:hypothetical protein
LQQFRSAYSHKTTVADEENIVVFTRTAKAKFTPKTKELVVKEMYNDREVKVVGTMPNW